MGRHLVLTGNVHPLNTVIDENSQVTIAKIPCTSHMVAFDSNLARIYILLMQDPTVTERVETDGNWNSDIVLCSCLALDGYDNPDARVLHIAVDDSGYYIYALVFSKADQDMYVKTFQLNLIVPELTPCVERIKVPQDTSPFIRYIDFQAYTTTGETVSLLTSPHIGKVICEDGMISGTGMEWVNGRLYIMTQREVHMIAKSSDMQFMLTSIIPYYSINKGAKESFESLGVYQFGFEEEREALIRFFLITVLDPYTGELYGHYQISRTGEGLTESEWNATQHWSSFFHGLTFTDDSFFISRHRDTYSISNDTSTWHLKRGRYVDPISDRAAELGRTTFGSDWGLQFFYGLKWQYANTAVGHPPPILLADTEMIKNAKNGFLLTDVEKIGKDLFKPGEFDWLFHEVKEPSKMHARWLRVRGLRASASNRIAQSTYIPRQERGHPEIIRIPFTSFQRGNKKSPEFKRIGTQISEYGLFPFDTVIPYSMTADRGNRKMYFAMGTSIWTFDMLGYTLISEHKTGQHFGDIIDFNQVKEGVASDILVYFRNDEPWTMYNIELWLPYYEDGDERWADVFLLKNPTDVGYKSIALGHLDPGQSASFIVRVYCLRVNDNETGKEHRVPLRARWTWIE